MGLWLWVAHIRMNGAVTVAVYGHSCLLAIFAAMLKRRLRACRAARDCLLAPRAAVSRPLLLIGVLAAWRFYQACDLALPACLVHHTLLVWLDPEGGGLPILPYIPARPIITTASI